MSDTTAPVLQRYRAAVAVIDGVPPTVDELRVLSDAELFELSELQTRGGRGWGSGGAVIAGEFAHRSRPELRSDGLARRTGHRTVETLLKATTGATKEQVFTALEAGTLLVEIADEGKVDTATGEVCAPSQPWMREVAAALAAGHISTSASGSIGRGLGKPNSAVTAEQLAGAASQLVAQAIAGVDPDKLFRNARDLRNEADIAGIAIREDEARALRSLTHYPLQGGGGMASWRMDAETYALFVDFYDRTTSPKRSGVRFIEKTRAAMAKRIEEDPRDYKQLASDGLIQLLIAGANADPTVMIGSGAPIIRVTVAEPALISGVGFGRIDGQAEPISLGTVKRLMETGKTIRVGFDPTGAYIDSSRIPAERSVCEKPDDPAAEHRLFNSRQREILAAKFGGCMDPNCDRPPSWCEAHHIEWVVRDGGKTTIANGILLCKYHHLEYHNKGIEIRIDRSGRYWKILPKHIDPQQSPIAMPLKTRNLRDLWAAENRASGSPCS